MKLRASSVAGASKKGCGGARLDDAATMQQDDLAGQPPRLAEIVGRHHDLDAARGDGADHVLDRLGRGGIEAGGRLVEEQHVGSRASARASASRCCSPPDSRRAGRVARMLQPDERQQLARRAGFARRAAPAAAARSELAAALRRSMVGRWKTMARRARRSPPPQ